MHVPANTVQAAKVWGPPGRPATLGDLQAEGLALPGFPAPAGGADIG